MSTTTATQHNLLTSGQLPVYAPWVVLAGSVAATAGVLALLDRLSLGLTVALGVLVFFVAIMILSASVEGMRRAKDRVARYVVTSFFVIALLPLVSLVIATVGNGLSRFDATFFSMSLFRITDPASGGVVHAVWGTLIITGIASLISVPIGLFTAIYLVEYAGRGRLAAAIRFFVDVMTGIPSIVAGLFAYTVFSTFMGPGTYSGMSGAVALAILMIPTVVRSAEEMLRLVPSELREASYALGVPKWRTIISVVLPTSIAGLVTGVILAIARVIGETAPLLIAAGTAVRVNLNPMQGSMATIPTFVYSQAREVDWVDRAWAGALTLIIIVMALNAVGRLIAWKFAPKAGR